MRGLLRGGQTGEIGVEFVERRLNLLRHPRHAADFGAKSLELGGAGLNGCHDGGPGRGRQPVQLSFHARQFVVELV